VTRIEVIPPIKDSRYHRVFMKAMKDVYSIVVYP